MSNRTVEPPEYHMSPLPPSNGEVNPLVILVCGVIIAIIICVLVYFWLKEET